MQPFRKILFPVDLSAATASMAPCVREMAQRFRSNVTILNAFNLVRDYVLAPPLGVPWDVAAAPIPYVPAFEELRKERQRHLDEFAHTYFEGVPHTAELGDGDPASVIESVTQRENTDLIVMPTRGGGVFRRLLLGSVTAKVLHDVHRPVLTCAHEPEPVCSAGAGYRSILCAVELNREEDVIFRAAGLLARAYAARLCLVHIQGLALRQEEGLAELQSIREAFERALRADGCKLTGEPEVRIVDDRSVPDGVRRIATEESADLVVVGRGREQGRLSRMWSDLYAIIRESPCPVFSV